MCLAQGPQRSYAAAAPRSRVKHSTTEQLCSHTVGHTFQIKKNVCVSRLNSVDPDKMPHVRHCLPNCAYRSYW